jgi:isoleucyl-tRNA synthetase
LHFAHDDSELAKISAKPSFAGIKAKGVEYAKNMKNISAAISGLDAGKIRDMQGGGLLSVCGLDVDYSCLMIVREVAEGLAVEADENYTAALDLKLTPELRQSCMARELVNRIQNRRKEMDLQITDRVRIYLSSLDGYADLRSAVERHRDYILEETQGVEISFEGIADNAAAVVEGCEIGVGVVAVT